MRRRAPKVEAVLNGYDANGNPIDDLGKVGISYLFDWFLGSQEAYEEDSIQNQRSLKYDLETFRGATNHTSTITVSDLDNWDGQDTEGNSIPNASRIKERLKGLLTTPDAERQYITENRRGRYTKLRSVNYGKRNHSDAICIFR